MTLLKENIHFVVGMSRAGTTWMSKCLNTHPSCASFGETLFWGRLYRPPANDGVYSREEILELLERLQSISLEPSDNDYGSLQADTVKAWYSDLVNDLADKDLSTPDKMFYSLCEFIAKHENKAFVVEKTPHHLNWIDRIHKDYAKSKYIIMIREPYGFMKSYKNQGLQRDDRVRKIHEKQYHPIQAALVWRGYSRSVRKAQTEFPDYTLTIKNEDLFKNSHDILIQVAEFIGLPDSKLIAEKLPGRTNSSVDNTVSKDMDSADFFWLNLIAGNEIKNMGYELRKGDFAPLLILWSFIRLPLWGIRTIQLLRSNSKANLIQYFWRWIK